ncbi:hypothetical protein VSDG_09678 [Cytospora chrysosperma]|uniref:Uncharacterized protein n=1 Tax=Cytospora chrysosperma TaxID=252740 RepID=A0A423V9A3_CYTCH|nr:hypothetical protein VSDG_09678 [Valsa sordida]
MPRKNSFAMDSSTGYSTLEYLAATPRGRNPPRKKSVPADGNPGYMAMQWFGGVTPQYMRSSPSMKPKKKSHHGHASHGPERPSQHDSHGAHGRFGGHAGGSSRPHGEDERREPPVVEQLYTQGVRMTVPPIREPQYMEPQCMDSPSPRRPDHAERVQPAAFGGYAANHHPQGNAPHYDHEDDNIYEDDDDDNSDHVYHSEPDDNRDQQIPQAYSGRERPPAGGQARYGYIHQQQSLDSMRGDDGSEATIVGYQGRGGVFQVQVPPPLGGADYHHSGGISTAEPALPAPQEMPPEGLQDGVGAMVLYRGQPEYEEEHEDWALQRVSQW